MIKQLLILFSCLLILSGNAMADGSSFELNLNDESAQGRFEMPINQDYYGTSKLNFRGLYNDEDEQSLWLSSVGMSFLGTPEQVPGLELGVIVEASLSDSDTSDTEFGALGIGVRASYLPPALSGFGFSSRLVYAPEIFTFREAEGFNEFSIRASYNITPKIDVHVEYQKIEVEYDDFGDVDIDDNVRLGFKAYF